MLIEILIISSVVTSGSLMLRSYGMKGWGIAPLGFLVSIAAFNLVFAAAAVAQFELGISFPGYLPLLLTFVALAAIGLRSQKLRKLPIFTVKSTLLVMFLVSVLVILFYGADLVRFHSDSLKFLFGSEHLFYGSLQHVDAYFIDTRLSTVSIIHSLGHMAGNDYLRSLTPMISISLLTSFAWIVVEGARTLKKNISLTHLMVLIGSGILLMISSHSYVFHSFYLNGHLMIAAFMLITAGAGWLISIRSSIDSRALLVIMVLGSAGLVFTRVEGFLYAIAATAPLIGSSSVALGIRKQLAIGLGASIVIMQVLKISLLGVTSLNVLMHSIPVLMMGLAIIAFGMFFIDKKIIKRFEKHLVTLLELGFWGALLLLFLRDQSILNDSLVATYKNIAVSYSPWGLSLITLISLFILVASLRKFKNQIYIRLPITLFIPTVFVIAYLRDGAYRVAHADSLNRMLIQLVPLVVLFIILGIGIGKDRIKRLSTGS